MNFIPEAANLSEENCGNEIAFIEFVKTDLAPAANAVWTALEN